MNKNSTIPSIERRLLSELLLDRKNLLAANDGGIEGTTWYVPAHAEIFKALNRLSAEAYDVSGLMVELEKDGLLDQVGGITALTQISDIAPTSFHLRKSIQSVADAARARVLETEARGMIEAIKDHAGAVPDSIALSLERMALTLEGKGEAPILDMLDARAFSVSNQTDKPKLRVWLGGSQICTSGNLSALIAQAKAGKSTVVGAILAAFLGADEDEALGFKAANPEGFAVLHFDTEQSNYDSDQLIRRSMARAGVPVVPRWFLSYRLAGLQPKQVRLCIQKAITRAIKAYRGVALIVIDGVADAVVDVNDPSEGNPYIAELQGTAIDRDCPILCIIHQNPHGAIKAKGPESSKARGHLGSQLERKCESNIYITKGDDGVSVLWSDKMRGAPIPLARGPAFAWHDELSRHVLVRNPYAELTEKKTSALAPELDVAWPSNAGSMKKADLVEQLSKRNSYTTRTAERRLKAMIDGGLLEVENGVVRKKT
jgi:hypothetical protein